MRKELIKISKFISLVLRHNPKAVGLKLDSNGWASINELILGARKKGYRIDRIIIDEIIDTNEKKRYIVDESGDLIRANQGHSISVDLELKPVSPPNVLYHGTTKKKWESIVRQGLKKIRRNYVHLSSDIETAFKVGSRHGKPIILIIDSEKMDEKKHKFFCSVNGVWLTESVPVEFISLEN